MIVACRHATPADCDFVYGVAMDPVTRAMSTRSDHFTLEQHREWYLRRIADPDHLFLIGTVQGEAIGYLRYGRLTKGRPISTGGPVALDDEPRAEIAIAIAREHRGRGYAVALLAAGEAEARRVLAVSTLTALVLPVNVASVRLFIDSSFRYMGTEERMGKTHLRFDRSLV